MASQVKIGIGVDDSQFKQGMNEAASAANSFGKSMTSAGQKTQTFMGQLRAARKTVMELRNAYDQLDEAAKNSDFGRSMQQQIALATQEAGRLTDLKSDVMREIKAVGSDTFAFDAAKEGIGVLSSGLQGLASIYGLCGGETKEFARALVAVNAVQGVANTLISIGNSLQKESSLMTMLRTMKSKLFTTATVAATAAETAETVATGANTTATITNIGATTAATAAQWKLNAAVLANPYVLAAAAIAALVGGVYLWIDSMDEATDAEIALQAATEAMEGELNTTMKTAADQIILFDKLKTQYDECGGKTDDFSKKLINNKEVQKKLGVTVKSVHDVHRLFAQDTPKFAQAANQRAIALAAEAAKANVLGQVLSKLTTVYAKLSSGEEVNWEDMRKVIESAGYSADAADKLMKGAGFKYLMDWGKGDILQGSGNLEKLITNVMEGGVFTALDNIASEATSRLEGQIKEMNWTDIFNTNEDLFGDKTEKSAKKAHKAAKSTKEEVKKILTTLEGCDAIISDAEKQMKKLDSTGADYVKKMQQFKAIILSAKAAKIKLLDTNTLQGLTDARSIMQQVIKELPVGSKEWDEWNEKIKQCDLQLLDMYKQMAKTGDLESMKNLRSQIEKIIATLPEGSEELRRMVTLWREINTEIVKVDENISNMKAGIDEGSIKHIEQQISKLKTRLENENLDLSTRTDIEEQIKELEKKKANISVDFVIEKQKPIDITFDYKKTPLEKAQRDFDHIRERVEYLRKIINDNNTPDWGIELAKEELDELLPKFEQLKKAAKFTELSEDIKQYTKSMQEAGYESFKGFTDSLHTVYNVISDLPDRLDECSDGFQGFFEILDAGFSIVDSVVSFIETIKKMTEIVQMLTAAKTVMNGVNSSSAATTTEETVALTSQATAQGTATAAQAAATPIMLAQAEAAKQLAAAQLDLATATIASAHASIPFVGPALAAAGIATVMAAITAAHTAFAGLQAFAEGGVVQGSHTMGDQLLVRVNAGEAILNKRQQANLFDLLDKGVSDNQGTNLVTSSVRIKGSDLIIALKNEDKTTHALSKYLNKQ